MNALQKYIRESIAHDTRMKVLPKKRKKKRNNKSLYQLATSTPIS